MVHDSLSPLSALLLLLLQDAFYEKHGVKLGFMSAFVSAMFASVKCSCCQLATAAAAGPQDAFYEKHGVKLGFMSAFVKAAASALQEVPAVNGVIDGQEIIYRCDCCWLWFWRARVGLMFCLIEDQEAFLLSATCILLNVQHCSSKTVCGHRRQVCRPTLYMLPAIPPAGTTLTSALLLPPPRAWWCLCCAVWTSSALQRWRR